MPDLKKMLTLEALSEALPSWLKRSTKPEYNADEIDSTLTTNQFVTASDKENWNAKGTYSKPSSGIPKSDLSSIVQTSLEKADSALQSETDPTVPSWAKQSSKPSYTQDEVSDGSTYKRVTQTEKDTWSGKQNALTTTQMQAVNSGITSEGVAQISTNQANILYALNRTGKNLLNTPSVDSPVSTYSGSWVTDSDGYITATNTSGDSRSLNYESSQYKIYLKPGNYKFVVQIKTSTTSASAIAAIYPITGSSVVSNSMANKTGTQTWDFTISTEGEYGVLTKLYTGSWRMMICEADMYAKDSSYVPYAIPNSDLTRLEAEDRAALVEDVDGGAKNKWDFANPDSTRSTDITKNSNGSFTISCTNATWTQYFKTFTVDIGKSYALSFNVDSMTNASSFIVIGRATNSSGTEYFSFSPSLGENRRSFTATASSIWIAVYINNSGTARSATATIEPMICTKASFGVSQKYVPYRVPYETLGKIKWKSYELNLAAITFTKSAGGAFYYSFSVSDDFSSIIAASLNGFSYIPNKGYSATMNNNSLTVGLIVYDATNPATLEINNGQIWIMVLGFS